MTTAEVFRDYLAMTPANAPWAFGVKQILQCLSCLKDVREVPVDEQAFMGVRCDYCCEYLSCGGLAERFTATSPLAPAPNPAWLYELVQCDNFHGLNAWCDSPHFTAKVCIVGRPTHVSDEGSDNPIHACARALIAADPALRARLEACSDWKEYAG